MGHIIARWLPVAACLVWAVPAHAQSAACDPGDTLLGSTTSQAGNQIIQTNTCAKTTGPWPRAELNQVFAVWNSIPNTRAKTWAMANIGYERRKEEVRTQICVIGKDGVKSCPPVSVSAEMLSPWAGVDGMQAKLIFNDRFSQEPLALQRSLFGFESGKAFYAKLNLEAGWYAKNLAGDGAALNEMLAGVAPGMNLSDHDESSMFGALYRVAMLQIPTAGHPGWQAPLAKLDAMLRRLTPP